MSCVIFRRGFRSFVEKNTIRAVLFSTQIPAQRERQYAKIVNVAIIGAPNSGKSTLINKVLERKVCASSNKVHTTTKLARAMTYEDDTQIIFLDTPGVVTEKEKKKYNLPESMLGACHKSLRCANVIGVVHDAANRHTKDDLHKDVVRMLHTVENIPSFLVINKIDTLASKQQLLTLIRNLTNGYIAGKPLPDIKSNSNRPQRGYSHFSDVFLVSALNGDGVQDIKQYLLSNAKPASLQYSTEAFTDQKPENLVVDTVRAKLLDFLPQEIPYNLNTQLEYFEENNEEKKIVCSLVVECVSDRLLRLISGAGGGRLQQIKSEVRKDLLELFQKTVIVDIRMKVKNKSLDEL